MSNQVDRDALRECVAGFRLNGHCIKPVINRTEQATDQDNFLRSAFYSQIKETEMSKLVYNSQRRKSLKKDK